MAKTRHCSSAPFLLLSKFQAATLSRLTPTHQQPTNDMSDEMKRSGLRSPNSSYHIQMSPASCGTLALRGFSNCLWIPAARHVAHSASRGKKLETAADGRE